MITCLYAYYILGYTDISAILQNINFIFHSIFEFVTNWDHLKLILIVNISGLSYYIFLYLRLGILLAGGFNNIITKYKVFLFTIFFVLICILEYGGLSVLPAFFSIYFSTVLCKNFSVKHKVFKVNNFKSFFLKLKNKDANREFRYIFGFFLVSYIVRLLIRGEFYSYFDPSTEVASVFIIILSMPLTLYILSIIYQYIYVEEKNINFSIFNDFVVDKFNLYIIIYICSLYSIFYLYPDIRLLLGIETFWYWFVLVPSGPRVSCFDDPSRASSTEIMPNLGGFEDPWRASPEEIRPIPSRGWSIWDYILPLIKHMENKPILKNKLEPIDWSGNRRLLHDKFYTVDEVKTVDGTTTKIYKFNKNISPYSSNSGSMETSNGPKLTLSSREANDIKYNKLDAIMEHLLGFNHSGKTIDLIQPIILLSEKHLASVGYIEDKNIITVTCLDKDLNILNVKGIKGTLYQNGPNNSLAVKNAIKHLEENIGLTIDPNLIDTDKVDTLITFTHCRQMQDRYRAYDKDLWIKSLPAGLDYINPEEFNMYKSTQFNQFTPVHEHTNLNVSQRKDINVIRCSIVTLDERLDGNKALDSFDFSTLERFKISYQAKFPSPPMTLNSFERPNPDNPGLKDKVIVLDYSDLIHTPVKKMEWKNIDPINRRLTYFKDSNYLLPVVDPKNLGVDRGGSRIRIMEGINNEKESKSSSVIYSKGLFKEIYFIDTVNKPMYYSIYDVANTDTIKYGGKEYNFQKYSYNMLDKKDFDSVQKFLKYQAHR